MSCLAVLLRAVPLPAPIVASALLAHQLPQLPGQPVALALLAGGLLALALGWRRSRWHGWRLLAVGIAAGGWTMHVAERALDGRLDVSLEGRDLVVIGRVASMPLRADRGTRFAFDVERCVPDESPCPDRARLRLSWHAFGGAQDGEGDRGAAPAAPQPGQRWQLNVRLRRTHALHNPGAFDAELRALEEGIAANGYVRASRRSVLPNERLEHDAWTPGIAFERARTHLRGAMQAALADARPDVAGVLVALVVGDQAAIGSRWWEVFNKTGVGHLMSISGLHVTMLAGLAVALARRALRTRAVARSGLPLRWPANNVAWLFGLATAFAYAGLAGWGIPAQRTCWMLAVAGASLIAGRTRSIAQVLALAAGVVTVLDPWAPLAAGFWLSFAAVGAITLHASARRPRAARKAGGGAASLARRAGSMLVEAARTQWAATLALVPLGALFFSGVSLVGPLANAIAIPLVSALITPLAMLGAAFLPWLPGAGAAPLGLAALLTGWMLDALRPLSDSRWAMLVVAQPGGAALALAAAALALGLWPAKVPARPAALAGLLPLFAPAVEPPQPGALRVTAFDVGQGMAVLVETPERRLLYDAGPLYGGDSEAGARVILPWLRARGIDHLDALVVSHLDSDHSGGVPSLLRNLRIDWIAGSLPGGHPAREAGRPFHDCRRGLRWRWGEVSFEFLHPGLGPVRGAKSPTNASSCVLRVASPAARVLLTGDIEASQERELVGLYGDAGLRADLMLAPHHGSSTSSSAAFLAAVAPAHAIAQVGFRNRFGHPPERVVERYRASGIALLRSDRDGAITLRYAVGRAPALERSRVDDRRYWRIRLEDEPVTARSSPRPSPRPRRAPARPPASRGTPSVRRAARASRTPATAASPKPARSSPPRRFAPTGPRARRSASAPAPSAPIRGRSRCR